MPETKPSAPARPPGEKQPFLSPMAASLLLLAVVGGGAFLYLERLSKQPVRETVVLTGEARAYIRAGNLALSGTGMKATQSYMGGTLVEITGKITNKGDRDCEVIELYCVFHDAYGQVCLRQRVPIVSRKAGGLAPGETKDFRLPFDDIPESWNQDTPQLVIAQIVFSQ